MLCVHSKYLVTLRLVPTCSDQKNAHYNVNITSTRNSEPKRTHHRYRRLNYFCIIVFYTCFFLKYGNQGNFLKKILNKIIDSSHPLGRKVLGYLEVLDIGTVSDLTEMSEGDLNRRIDDLIHREWIASLEKLSNWSHRFIRLICLSSPGRTN